MTDNFGPLTHVAVQIRILINFYRELVFISAVKLTKLRKAIIKVRAFASCFLANLNLDSSLAFA